MPVLTLEPWCSMLGRVDDGRAGYMAAARSGPRCGSEIRRVGESKVRVCAAARFRR
jgi:hypothetical protein